MRCLRSVVFVLSPAIALADPLFQTLPEDGIGTKFHVNMTLNGKESVRTWEAHSMGRRDVDGKPARWIELHGEAYEGGFVYYRLLIPEAEFGRGEHPIGKAVQVWRRFDKRDPEQFESIQVADAFLATLLAGAGDGTKKLDETKHVEWQKGNFDCDVLEGSSQLTLSVFDLAVQHRSFFHDKAPFGFAGTRQEFQITVNDKTDKATIEARLLEIVKGRAAAFPAEK